MKMAANAPLKGIINVSFTQSLIAIGRLHDFSEFLSIFFVKFSIFSNGDNHVWLQLGSSTVNLKVNYKCIIYPNFGSNWPFTKFFRIFLMNFLSNFLFLVTVAGMFDGGWGHQPYFLKRIIHVLFTQSLVAIGPLQDILEFFDWIVKFSIFSNGVWWRLGSSTKFLNGDHTCIIYQFGSNWPFTVFFRILILNFLSNFLFSVTVAAIQKWRLGSSRGSYMYYLPKVW